MGASSGYGDAGGAATAARGPITGMPVMAGRGVSGPAKPADEPDESGYCDWLRAIASNEEAALEAFYDATVKRVYGLALRITRQPASAEEVVSDVYLQVWRDAKRYDAGRGKVVAWLMTICRSRALDLLRRADEAEPHPEPDSLRREAPDGDSAQDLLQATQQHAWLHRALAKLNPLQRQLIALAFFRGLSHQEIAAHARLPLGSVKTFIRSGLKQMREHLPDSKAA